MQSQTTEAVSVEIRIAARPETVFSYFTDPQRMLQWQGRAARLDPRPGGEYWVDVNGQHVSSGRFVEVVPPERLVFTWGWEGEGHPIPPGSTTVELALVPDGAGTLLRLTHRGLPADAHADHRTGWQHYLDRLALLAGGGDPGPDPWANAADLSVVAEPATS